MNSPSAANSATALPWLPEFAPLIVCVVGAGAFYLWGIRMRVRSPLGKNHVALWFTPRHLSPFATQWPMLMNAGAFWTSAFMALSILTVHVARHFFFMLEKSPKIDHVFQPVLEFPGLFFIFITASLGTAALINTICILNNTVFEVRTFGDIASSIEEFGAFPGKDIKSFEKSTYLIDYIPNVGVISDWSAHIRIYKAIEEWLKREDSVTHFMFLPPKRYYLEELHQKNGLFEDVLGPREKFIQEIVSKSNSPDKEILYSKTLDDASTFERNWDSDYSAVWFADGVSFEHYIVSNNSAVSYYVIPDEDKSERVNQVRGSRQTDVKHIKYLSDVCVTYLRRAITPRLAITQKIDENGTEFWETEAYFDIGQRQIESIVFEPFDANRIPLNCGHQTFTIDQSEGDLLPGQRYFFRSSAAPAWIKLRLKKRKKLNSSVHGDGSPPNIVSEQSFFVRVQPRDQDSDFILPSPPAGGEPLQRSAQPNTDATRRRSLFEKLLSLGGNLLRRSNSS